MILDKRIWMKTMYRLVVIFAISNTVAGETARAIAVLASNRGITGTITFAQEPNKETILVGCLAGLTPGLHGFHVHANGDISEDCKNTGPHFNPFKRNHGAPTDDDRHAGDLGNIEAEGNGTADFIIKDWQIPLTGPNSVIGRAVVVHAKPDDLGKGGTELSKTTGNAGEKIACGVIGTAGP